MVTKVKINFLPLKVLSAIGVNSPKFRMALANEIITVSDPFVPFREGYLKNSAAIINEGSTITYSTPYARRLWYGDTYNFSGAPSRGSRWVDRAMAVRGNEVIVTMEKLLKEGRFVNG